MKRCQRWIVLTRVLHLGLASLLAAACSHNSTDTGGSVAGLDCSNQAIAASSHPAQQQMDCAAAKHARSKMFQAAHDCSWSNAAKQPNPDEFYAQCQGDTWDGKHSDIWKQTTDNSPQEMPKARSGILAPDPPKRASGR